MMESIAKKTAQYVLGRPFVKECLKKGLVNFSSLARKIIEEERFSKKDFDAVVVALRRIREKSLPSSEFEKKIVSLLKKGKLEMKNKISVVVLDDHAVLSQLAKIVNSAVENNETLHLVHGSRTFTIITSFEISQQIAHVFRSNVVSEKNNLVEIVLRTGREIESTPGVVAFLYSRFAENGINIIETLSSWTETLFVIEEKDVEKAIEALKF